MATGPPSLPRLAHKLRHSVLDPPHRATPLQKPPNDLTGLVFYLGAAGHHRQIRRLRTLPDLAERSVVIAVSPVVFPLSPFARPYAAPAVSPQPELAAAGHVAVAAMACFGRVRARL